MSKRDSQWEELAGRRHPSWYLDRLVAEQKRQQHQELVRRWTNEIPVGSVLKTDLFEEAYGEDQILFDLFPYQYSAIGIDVAFPTVRRASRRCPMQCGRFAVTDVRKLALRSEVVDLIISNSTLDHFDSEAEFKDALGELARTLRPGGLFIVTMDNALNPFYLLLRWLTRLRLGPFPLGYTTSPAGLVRHLEAFGLEVIATDRLIHNPRLISTLLFLALRRLLGKRADTPIRGLLRLFASLQHLPTQAFTACFIAACARKPE